MDYNRRLIWEIQPAADNTVRFVYLCEVSYRRAKFQCIDSHCMRSRDI